MRETSLPLTTPFPELSEKLDLLFKACTKSVKEITFGLFLFGLPIIMTRWHGGCLIFLADFRHFTQHLLNT
jgi:hypothetical protein